MQILTLAIPYFEQPQLKVGPLTFHAFGALVAIAVLFGTWILKRRSLEEGLDAEVSGRMVFWALVVGFIGAHLVDRFVYFPEKTFKDPLSILKVWEGISSFGGIMGGVLGAALFIRREKLPAPLAWRYLDAIAYAFVHGWIFGRLGCFTAFDHPGTKTDFFLGQYHPDPLTDSMVKIHNLGLYEAIYFVPLAVLYWALGRKKHRPPGFYVALIAVVYPPVRFGLDFLRVVDVRYAGLTPAQWGSIAFVGLGLYLFAYGKKLAAADGEGAKKGGGGGGGKKKRR
jgi:phosphatidylglycerol:prolipoprotein diacylglycerol transferase